MFKNVSILQICSFDYETREVEIRKKQLKISIIVALMKLKIFNYSNFLYKVEGFYIEIS